MNDEPSAAGAISSTPEIFLIASCSASPNPGTILNVGVAPRVPPGGGGGVGAPPACPGGGGGGGGGIPGLVRGTWGSWHVLLTHSHQVWDK